MVLAVEWEVDEDCMVCLNLSVVAIYRLLGIAYIHSHNDGGHSVIDGLWFHPR